MAALFPQIRPFPCPDGMSTYVRIWEADAPVARMLCLHGIISHGGWYNLMCRRLAQLGCEVHFLDRRGSGLNAKSRGDVDRFESWLADVEMYLDQFPSDVPRVLAGISWGGKLAAAVARHRPDLLDGLALICPGLFAPRQAGVIQQRALRAAGRLGLRRRRVWIPLREPELFTDSADWQQYIAYDPLTLRQVTIGFALSDLDLNRAICTSPHEIRTPTLLVLAGRDRIVDNAKVREFFERVSADEKQLIEFRDAAHTLEFESDPEPFFLALRSWVGGLRGGASGSSVTRE